MPVPTTIAAYDAFILYPAHRYDIKGKRILKQEKKYYAVDLGMRRILCSNNVRDIGRLLENVVFLELMRREGDVYVGQSSGGEIDFVTNGPGGVGTTRSANRCTTRRRWIGSCPRCAPCVTTIPRR